MTEQLTLFGSPEPTEPVPEHVERSERKGMIDALFSSGRMFTRNASRHRCPSCRQQVLSAVDGDLAASSVTVDPTPLTNEAELACKLSGRLTYRLRIREGRAQLDDRDPVWTGAAPAGAIIVPEHMHDANGRAARFPGELPWTTREICSANCQCEAPF